VLAVEVVAVEVLSASSLLLDLRPVLVLGSPCRLDPSCGQSSACPLLQDLRLPAGPDAEELLAGVVELLAPAEAPAEPCVVDVVAAAVACLLVFALLRLTRECFDGGE